MCRWLAYVGPAIFLEQLIFEPRNSLISQSLNALQGVTPTNGDGFGIGWYRERPEPGLFREVQPAWNDENLRSLSAQIRSHHFFAHVRAATGTPVARTNSHPFRFGPWLFMHNGQIGGFSAIRRKLTFMVTPNLFPHMQGTTDSELFFYLLLSEGLETDPAAAFARAVGHVLAAMAEAGIEDPFRMTAALSNGQSIHALRYASDDKAPSLYYGCGASPEGAEGQPCGEAKGETGDGSGQSILVLSEPLDHSQGQWQAVDQASLLIAGQGGIAEVPFSPHSPD